MPKSTPRTLSEDRLSIGIDSIGGADDPKRAPSPAVCGAEGRPGMSDPPPSLAAHPRVYPYWSHR